MLLRNRCVVGMALTVLAICGHAQQTTVPKPLNVTVVNDTLRPVPVTGSLGITGDVTVANEVSVTGLDEKAVEPGRTPYQRFGRVDQSGTVNASQCIDSFTCFHTFEPVPAGHRLVVTHIMGKFFISGSKTGASVGVTDSAPLFRDWLEIPVVDRGDGTVLGSAPVTFFVGPGQSPSVVLSGNTVFPLLAEARVRLIGYLVPLSN
jgi:hypothetical protein